MKKKEKKNQKGQAAIEYLTTYGWAIIVLLIMVSALSFFGVLDVRDLAPDRCEIGAEFFCKDHVFVKFPTNVTLHLMLINNLPDRILIESINCTFESTDSPPVTFPTAISIGSDKEQEIKCDTDNAKVMGMRGKIKADFTIVYQKRDGLFKHEVSGSAFSGLS